MPDRPGLSRNISGSEFREYYYLKEELTAFCRENGLPVSGSKTEIADRIADFLDTGEIHQPSESAKRKSASPDVIAVDSIIEADIVCSEKHRAFFREKIGNGFSFNVAFQKWLKGNAGKTYGEAISAYYEILKKKSKAKPPLTSNSSIILISAIFLRIIKEKR